MKRVQIKVVLLLAAVMVFLAGGPARADLNAYIHDLNVAARTDLQHYRAQVGARFGIDDAEFDLIYRTVNGHGEVAVLLWLKERCGLPLDNVLGRYREHEGQGWGALAKSLGIKPGSDDFHRLKAGDLGWHPDAAGGTGGKGPGQEKGKSKSKKSYYRY